jgi:hypothetical protein
MPQELPKLVRESYPRIAEDLLAPLLDLMILSREHCGGDLEKFLIVLVVAIRTTEHKDFAGFSHEELISGKVPVFPSLGTNGRSIAASAGIPKETVRRKVAELVDAGWFVRRGHNLYFTAQAFQQLAPVRESIEELAVRYHEVVGELRRR